jgi:predicted dehydrogenase
LAIEFWWHPKTIGHQYAPLATGSRIKQAKDRSTRLFIDQDGDLFGGGTVTETFPVCDQYTLQGDAFSKAVLDGTEVPVPLEEAIRNMAVIEALFRSGETGQWESTRR